MLGNKLLCGFICDYCRLIIIGSARSFEIEALMDEEIQTLTYDKLKPYHALTAVGDGLPALGIVAAVLGIIHAMGALDQGAEVLGGLIGAALVGTFSGIFASYGIVSPLADADQDDAPEDAAPVHAREADPARLHERRHAADRGGIRPQDHSRQGAPDHRRGRERDHRRRRRQSRRPDRWTRKPEQRRGAAEKLLDNPGLTVERLPMLTVIFDRLAASCAEGMRPYSPAMLSCFVNSINTDHVWDALDAYDGTSRRSSIRRNSTRAFSSGSTAAACSR